MKVYNSLTRQKEEFIPNNKDEVKIYVCGPTVYNFFHLGNARPFVVFDTLRRYLKYIGYNVNFVQNFTDVDDKIINRAKEEGITAPEVSEKYIEEYFKDTKALNIIPADTHPRVSENIPQIIEFIQTLIDKGYAYEVDGDVYYSTRKFPEYGKLSKQNIEELEAGARVMVEEKKKDPLDFALWKARKEESEIAWESPWGMGRPGWHIECSAMIEEVLAYQNKEFAIDIHGGGADLLFPHHENEACQSRCATGRELAKYWMHNGFVNIDGQKMSKSLGNSFYIKDALKTYSGEVVRNYLLGTHYRALLHFNEEDMLLAKKRLDKIYRLKQRVASGFSGGLSGARAAMQTTPIKMECEFCAEILESMSDDLNISKALSALEEMIHSANTSLDSTPKDKELKLRILASLDFIWELLGIGGGDCVEYFQQGVGWEQRARIEELIAQRTQAKKARDFARADAIRTELESMGIVLSDTSDGTIWEVSLGEI